ncbi:agmatine deiminase family protein [Kitasatospora atroaurantiaca]|uniref:Agmatine deiminase n=1 Tax=Kitasatospora atroaurantiaca TaxID=285545 RepID=A0A561EXV8_9ACTN|nr:agmatine deiminase family protein [Kitasatospora atroaurantiaca]TWE20441.1 agmatine deiminase [Kitasatospora atroaurantiaca]
MTVSPIAGRPVSRRRFLTASAAVAAAATTATTATTATVVGAGAGRAAAATYNGKKYTVPGEWAPHARCIMAFPWDAGDGWGQKLHLVQDEVANIARSIARFEPVTMFAKPGTANFVQQQVGPTVTVVEYPINDCWTRDTAAIFGLDQPGKKLLGLDFGFNGWGNKYPYDKDDFLPVGVCDYLAVPRLPVGMVLEGGSVLQDGQGTLIATTECLLNPNRNPGMTQAQIEAALLDAFGATKMICLPYGLYGDDITNGHVDLVAAYVGPARLLINTQPDPGDPNHDRLNANKAVLQASTDALGRPFQLTEMPYLPKFTVGTDEVITFSYTNFYPTAAGIVVPTTNIPSSDNAALAVIQGLFPGREIVGAPATTLAWGGGGVHCITQQVPATS